MTVIRSLVNIFVRRFTSNARRAESSSQRYLYREHGHRDSKDILFDPSLRFNDMRHILLRQAENSLIMEFKGLKTSKFVKKIESFLADIGKVHFFSPIDTLRNIYVVQFEDKRSVSYIINQGRDGTVDSNMVSIDLEKDAQKFDAVPNKRMIAKADEEEDIQGLFDQQEDMNQQIEILTQRSQLSSADIRVNFLVLLMLQKTFRKHVEKNCKLHFFGSSFTGAGMKGADVDIVLITPSYEQDAYIRVGDKRYMTLETDERLEQQEERTRILQDIEVAVNQYVPETEDVEVFWGAKVQIIRFNLPLLNRSVDIAVNQMSGINFACLTNWYIRYNPNVMKLYIVIRKWAEARNLLSHGLIGLSPFMLLSLTLTYLIRIEEIPQILQIGRKKKEIFLFHSTPSNTSKRKTRSAEQLVYEYFKYFARYSPANARFLMHKGRIVISNQTPCLQIVNPFDPRLNIGQNCDRCYADVLGQEMKKAAKMMEFRRKKLKDRKWGLNALLEES